MSKCVVMNYDHIKNGLVILLACLGAYTSYVIIRDISYIYMSWLNFFATSDSIYPMLITAVTALLPLSCFVLAYFVFVDKFKIWLVLPLIHMLILFLNYISLFVCVLLVFWWVFKDRLPLSND